MTKQIPLTQGRFALVDDEDYEYLSQWKWHAHAGRNFYAIRNVCTGGKRTTTSMHRVVTGVPKDKHVDHINGDGLDNRRGNLRICTNTENQHNSKKPKNNTSGFKGVSWDKYRKKYSAYITFNKKFIHLGRFTSPAAAARAYDKAARKYFGKFAKTNF